MSELKGFVNIIKPTGMTSSDVVCKVKKILHMKKVGHLGTLDPAASGVLPVAIGRATKFFDYFLSKEKMYTAVVKFGIETDTIDSFGNITNIDNGIDVSEQEIEKVLPEFLGEIEQLPPKFSALKVNGKKAYELARDGVDFDLKSRKITIFDVNLRQKCEKNTFVFDVYCSAGTYIRTLFSDIAKRLNTIAFVPVIIRTKSGVFDINSAVTFEEFEQTKSVTKIEEIFNNFEIVEINDFMAKKVLNGVSVLPEELGIDKTIKTPFLVKYGSDIVGLYDLKNGKTNAIAFVYDN